MTYNFNQAIVSFTILKFSLITNFGLLKTQPNSHESMEISFFFIFVISYLVLSRPNFGNIKRKNLSKSITIIAFF